MGGRTRDPELWTAFQSLADAVTRSIVADLHARPGTLQGLAAQLTSDPAFSAGPPAVSREPIPAALVRIYADQVRALPEYARFEQVAASSALMANALNRRFPSAPSGESAKPSVDVYAYFVEDFLGRAVALALQNQSSSAPLGQLQTLYQGLENELAGEPEIFRAIASVFRLWGDTPAVELATTKRIRPIESRDWDVWRTAVAPLGNLWLGGGPMCNYMIEIDYSVPRGTGIVAEGDVEQVLTALRLYKRKTALEPRPER
jgi:hypothetical protein